MPIERDAAGAIDRVDAAAWRAAPRSSASVPVAHARGFEQRAVEHELALELDRAGHQHVVVGCAPFDDKLAARKADPCPCAPEARGGRRDQRRAGRRAAGERQPDPALPDPRPTASRRLDLGEGDVGLLGKHRMDLDPRAQPAASIAARSGDEEHRVRIAHVDDCGRPEAGDRIAVGPAGSRPAACPGPACASGMSSQPSRGGAHVDAVCRGPEPLARDHARPPSRSRALDAPSSRQSRSATQRVPLPQAPAQRAVVVVDQHVGRGPGACAGRSSPSSGRSRAPARDGWRAPPRRSAGAGPPRRSSTRILLPAPFMRAIRRPASGCASSRRHSPLPLATGVRRAPGRSRARRAASRPRATLRPRSPPTARARFRGALGARRRARGASLFSGGSGPCRNATLSTQRQPRCALTRATIIAALCCASSAKAPSTLQHQRRRGGRRVGIALGRRAAAIAARSGGRSARSARRRSPASRRSGSPRPSPARRAPRRSARRTNAPSGLAPRGAGLHHRVGAE